MKIVYSWLKDFVDITIPVEELADALTLSGLEVASIEKRTTPQGIVIGRVLAREPHPNADRLSVCRVDAGGAEPLTIVCGAPNVAAGMHVPCATIGTVFDADFVIKKSKLRGVESFGMLCSEKELGISSDNSGLMALPATTVPGTPFSDYYPDDAIIEIELTPDRGDCLSVIGVAREVAARFGLPLKITARTPVENSAYPINEAITVTVATPDLCPRYMGRLVRGVTIAPSPQWLQYRLIGAGIRPINNVVDVTNYMLLHFGQPMHGFDYQQIRDKKIIVKQAGSTTQFETLDGIKRELVQEDLLIHDGSRPVALAGIMGGAGSEITEATRDVFLECAYFNPIGVRKTAKRLGLSTDSSYRFERGVDPDSGLVAALNTAAALLAEISGGTVAAGSIDCSVAPMEKRTIIVRPSKVSSVLGVEFSVEQIVSFLESLQISCVVKSDASIACTVPLFRHDLEIEVDCIEEIGRMYGYDNIPPSHTMQISLHRSLPETEIITDTIRSTMAFAGMHETVTNSMISEKKCNGITPQKKPVALLNPLTPDMACMRTSLLSSLLDVAVYNNNRKNINNRLFEIGKVFEVLPGGNHSERTVLAILIEGDYISPSWNSSAEPVSFYVMKGIIETFARHLGTPACTFELPINRLASFTNETASVTIGNQITGYAGMVDEQTRKTYDLKHVACYAELDITTFIASTPPVPHYTALPRYPALERAFSFVMDEALSTSAIVATIAPLSPLIVQVTPFDIFRGEKLGAGKKSVTFSLSFRSPEKTLTEKDVEGLCEQIITSVATQHNACLRT